MDLVQAAEEGSQVGTVATIRWIATLATSALIVVGTTGSLCSPPFGACPMKCCAPASHYNLAIAATGCCRVEPLRDSSALAVTQPSITGPTEKHQGCVIAQNATLDASTPAIFARIDASGSLLAHRDPPPIYLLDVSILR